MKNPTAENFLTWYSQNWWKVDNDKVRHQHAKLSSLQSRRATEAFDVMTEGMKFPKPTLS